MASNIITPPKRFNSDYCDLCKVRGCHIQSCIDHVDNPAVFNFEMTGYDNRRLDIFYRPLVKIRGYEDNILMFEYRSSASVTEYFFNEYMMVRYMGNNATELIYGTVSLIKHPYNKSDSKEIWYNRLANHNIYLYEDDHE